jgi:hypothetical protein
MLNNGVDLVKLLVVARMPEINNQRAGLRVQASRARENSA